METNTIQVLATNAPMASDYIFNEKIIVDSEPMIQNYPNLSNNSNYATQNFKATVGDAVKFNAISEYDQFDNAVMIYGINRYAGAEVLGGFKSVVFAKIGIVYNDGHSPFPHKMLPLPIDFFRSI